MAHCKMGDGGGERDLGRPRAFPGSHEKLRNPVWSDGRKPN